MDNQQLNMFDDNPEYQAFVDKFKPKKTTDDCYTPPHIYDSVLNWAVQEYGLQDRQIVRPFYPGGDYENYPYPENCVVVDNPPFSILARIIDTYNSRGIDYFLFAPALTVLSSAGNRCNAVITDSSIIYENGANVKTAFVTNMGDYKIHVSSELYTAINDAQEEAKRQTAVSLPKYEYPENLLTSALIQKIARHGQTLKIKADDCFFVRSIDAQKSQGKVIYGAGFLLAEKAAAEKAAAEKAAAEKAAAVFWPLSERERMIIASLGGD